MLQLLAVALSWLTSRALGEATLSSHAVAVPCPALLPADSLMARQEEERDAAKGGLYGGRGGVHGRWKRRKT